VSKAWILTAMVAAVGVPRAASAAPGDAPAAPAPVVPIPAAPPAAPAPPSADKLAEARLHFQQGVALYQDHNYDAALAEFQGAYAASNQPVVLYNMGLTFKALFRYADAIDTLDRYLKESSARSEAITPERRAEVEGIIAEMKSLLADVTVLVQPAQATIKVDGRPVTMGIEGIVRLAAGTHSIEASQADYTSDHRDITVVAGVPQSVSLKLNPIPRTGHVKIASTQAGAHVSVDGRDLGAAPVEVELGAGGHHLNVAAQGFVTSSSELAIAPGQSRDMMISLDLPPPPPVTPFYQRWWFWGGVAAAVAVASVIVFWPHTQSPLAGTTGTTNADP
jgi:hypothetical protein